MKEESCQEETEQVPGVKVRVLEEAWAEVAEEDKWEALVLVLQENASVHPAEQK